MCVCPFVCVEFLSEPLLLSALTCTNGVRTWRRNKRSGAECRWPTAAQGFGCVRVRERYLDVRLGDKVSRQVGLIVVTLSTLLLLLLSAPNAVE